MIRVLVVEDSPVLAQVLVGIITADPDLCVAAIAHDGEEALAAVRQHRPDAITMDVHMPKMDGLEATRRIMQAQPTPIIIVSSNFDPGEVAATFRALEAGAVAVLARPEGPGHPEYAEKARHLTRMVKLMSEVKLVRRWPTRQPGSPPVWPLSELLRVRRIVNMVAIGASTGGPPALHDILRRLPSDFAAPVLIVQHMAAGFISGFAEWLQQASRFPVEVARAGALALPGRAYVAPDARHMEITAEGRLGLSDAGPENGSRPSISFLFRSVARAYAASAAGVLLTGMGKDGSDGLKLLKDSGALTIAQDEASCVVYGMPAEAIRLNAATAVLAPDQIAAALVSVGRRRQWRTTSDSPVRDGVL